MLIWFLNGIFKYKFIILLIWKEKLNSESETWSAAGRWYVVTNIRFWWKFLILILAECFLCGISELIYKMALQRSMKEGLETPDKIICAWNIACIQQNWEYLFAVLFLAKELLILLFYMLLKKKISL